MSGFAGLVFIILTVPSLAIGLYCIYSLSTKMVKNYKNGQIISIGIALSSLWFWLSFFFNDDNRTEPEFLFNQFMPAFGMTVITMFVLRIIINKFDLEL